MYEYTIKNNILKILLLAVHNENRQYKWPPQSVEGISEREMCPWDISKYFGDLVFNTSA